MCISTTLFLLSCYSLLIEGEDMSDIGFSCWNNTYCKGLKAVQNASEFTLKWFYIVSNPSVGI